MTTRTFTRDELEELGLPDSDHVVHTEQIDERRWYSIHHCVFRAEDNGPLWQVTYFEPLTELQEHDTWNDAQTVEAVQVEPYEATVTKYRPVQDAPAVHEDADPGTPATNRCAYCSEAIALVGGTWYHDSPHDGHPRDGHKATPANLTAPA